MQQDDQREGAGRRESDQHVSEQVQIERTRPTWATVLTIVTIVVGGFVAYAATNGSVDRRISILETKQDSNQQRLNEINGRLEQLNLKMDQVLMNSNSDRQNGH